MVASTNKDVIIKKSGIRKDVAVSVNKKSMHKSSSKNVFLRLQFFTLLQVAVYRGVFRTQSNIYIGAFFVKILNSFKLLTISGKESPLEIFD